MKCVAVTSRGDAVATAVEKGSILLLVSPSSDRDRVVRTSLQRDSPATVVQNVRFGSLTSHPLFIQMALFDATRKSLFQEDASPNKVSMTDMSRGQIVDEYVRP